MSTYPMSGNIPQMAKYVGEFVPSDQNVVYYYSVVAYDQYANPLTSVTGPFTRAWGPDVLDGNHAIQISWSPVIGAFYFEVFKSNTGHPDPAADDPFWRGSNETSILDVGYPCTTRNSFLNPGLSPIFAAGCCGDSASEATNVPPAGMAAPDDGHEGGGFVRIQNLGAMLFGIKTPPAGQPGDVQFNKDGRHFGASMELYWDQENQRLGIHTREPKYPLDVDGEEDYNG